MPFISFIFGAFSFFIYEQDDISFVLPSASFILDKQSTLSPSLNGLSS